MLKNHKNVYWTETRKKQDEENKKRLTDLQNKFKKNVSQEIEQKEIAVAKNISYQTIDVSISDLKNADKHFEESMVNNLYDRYFKSGGNLEQNMQTLDNDLAIAQAKTIIDSRTIVNYNNAFTLSTDKPVPKTYQEATSYNNLTPVFVDPLLFPHESFLNISKGRGFMSLDKASRKQFQKEWLIIRSFDEFVTIIPELFGIYEQPTRIPLALSLCFFFETISIPRPLLTSCEEEDPEMYQYEQDLIDKKSTQRYKPKNDEKTGLDCFRWLVQNNYVPEFVNLHDFNSRNLENNRELRALFSEWQEKNNVLPKVQEHWF